MKLFLAASAVIILFFVEKQLIRQTFKGTTIHLAGDSTMSVKADSRRPETGWGEPFATMLCDHFRVINHAMNGRSTKSFVSEGLWESLLQQVKAGDIVLIQFGHNDQKADQPELHTNPWQGYQENLVQFISDVRAQKAEPILLTSIVRRKFDSQGVLLKTLGDYPAVTRTVAKQMQVRVIDLNASTHELVQGMGPIDSRQLYVHLAPRTHHNYADGRQDDTHLNAKGAAVVATTVSKALKRYFPEMICH